MVQTGMALLHGMPTTATPLVSMLRFRPVPRSLPWLALLLVFAGAGCASTIKSAGPTEYSVSARQNYERGMKKLDKEDWTEAAKFFSFVKARFPYSKYSVLAELRLADTMLGGGAQLEAIDAYKQFMKFHPTHEMVTNGYAAYRIGDAYARMLPSDWFLIPPSYEMDTSSTIDALRELGLFIETYPTSEYLPKVQKMRYKCARLLAAHEWYVANFYWKRDRPMGTVLRLRTLLDKYPEVGYDEEALWRLGRAYGRVNRPEDARKTWETLVRKHPSHPRAREAQAELVKLKG